MICAILVLPQKMYERMRKGQKSARKVMEGGTASGQGRTVKQDRNHQSGRDKWCAMWGLW